MTQRAIIYIRQSKARDDSISIEIQEASVRAYCKQKGYRVADVVVDEGVSGYRDWKRRPNFPTALAAIQSGDADLVVVYRWSRLSRRRLDQLNLIDLLGTVEAAAESIDVSTAGGRMSRDMLMSIAAFESDVKSEQWKEALARRTAHGLPKNGLPRYGYTKTGKQFVPDPVTGPILRELFLRYTAGAGFQSLCQDLNERGITTTKGNPWGVHSMIRMLDSGFGAGLLCEGHTMTFSPGAHESVISDDEWTAYLQARDARRVLPAKRKNPRWVLSGLVTCGLCSRPVTVNTYAERKSQVRCTGYVNGLGCPGVWMRRQTIEACVEMFLVGWQADALASVLSAQRTEEADRARNHAETIERDLAAAQASLAKLAVGWSTGQIDDNAHASAQTELTRDRDRLAVDLTAARQEVSRLAPLGDTLSVIADAPTATTGERNQQFGRVIRTVAVHKDRLVFTPVVGDVLEMSR